MDVKLVNPFIEATCNVLVTMASTKAKAGKPYLKNDQVARGDVSGIIGLIGETSGTISVSFTEKSILAIISGQARQKLEELGRSLKAAIPTVIMGKNHSISHVTSYPVVAIPFSTDNGDFTIEVCLEHQESSAEER
jgi:chemotaxis protein CheX